MPPEPPSAGGQPLPEDARDAASAALARARAVARGKGLRPGSKPARRRAKDVPLDRRTDAARDFHTLGEEVESFIAERGWAIDVA
ncbi:MAG: DUF721 domain-containing protein, partial [Nostocoides sp.]